MKDFHKVGWNCVLLFQEVTGDCDVIEDFFYPGIHHSLIQFFIYRYGLDSFLDLLRLVSCVKYSVDMNH